MVYLTLITIVLEPVVKS